MKDKLAQVIMNVILLGEDIQKLNVRIEAFKRAASQICADPTSTFAKETADGIVEQAKAVLESAKTLKASILKN